MGVGVSLCIWTLLRQDLLSIWLMVAQCSFYSLSSHQSYASALAGNAYGNLSHLVPSRCTWTMPSTLANSCWAMDSDTNWNLTELWGVPYWRNLVSATEWCS